MGIVVNAMRDLQPHSITFLPMLRKNSTAITRLCVGMYFNLFYPRTIPYYGQ